MMERIVNPLSASTTPMRDDAEEEEPDMGIFFAVMDDGM
jgi:hypothetical protein